MSNMLAIIPRPRTMRLGAGCFTLPAHGTVAMRGPVDPQIASLLADYLQAEAAGPSWRLETIADASRATILLEQTDIDQPDARGFHGESYQLTVDASRIVLSAESSHGLARGIQTLRQLIPASTIADEGSTRSCRIPCVRIEDEPRFAWRGMMLDVARHFFTVEQVCQFIDMLALHRFNRLHLHLTDDQGWRIEIRRYPRLTEVGGLRARTLMGHERDRPRRYDQVPHGGYYTRQDIQRLVEFAHQRRIELIPEVDMPGHMQAAVAAYPELGNTDMTIHPRCHWGISQHILNVEPTTITFMQNVLAELAELFPGRLVHLGGDEALKHEWSECPRAQARMRSLGLENEEQLQHWFLEQMADRLGECGKRMIGWDEILQTGRLPAESVVMNWRCHPHQDAWRQAADLGHDVVMARHDYLYFDHYQAEPTHEEPLAIGGLNTTAHVYAYQPMPDNMPNDLRHHILGAQAQLWTEYIPDMSHLQYMTFPRACALAEALWLPDGEKNYREFVAALAAHRERLRALKINAHPYP